MLQKQTETQSSLTQNQPLKVRVFFRFDFNFIRTDLQIEKTATIKALICKALTTINSKIFDIQTKEACYEMFAAKKCGKKAGDLPTLLKDQTVGGTKLTHFYLQNIQNSTLCSSLYTSNTCLFSEMRPQRPSKYQYKEIVSPLRKRYACC